MKQKQIAEIIGSPSSTLKDWSKSKDYRRKLYSFLQKISLEEFKEINSRPEIKRVERQPKQHRLQHIVNRNSNVKFSLSEIISIFSSGDYENKNINEKIVIEKFFKECDAQDYKKLLLFKGVKAVHIKSLFLSSQASKSLYSHEWANILGVNVTKTTQNTTARKIPRGLALIQKRRETHA